MDPTYLKLMPTDLVKIVTDFSKTLYLVVQEDGEFGRLESSVKGIYTDFNRALLSLLTYFGCLQGKNTYDPTTKKWTYNCITDDCTEYRCYIKEIRMNEDPPEKPFIYAFSEVQVETEVKMRFLRYHSFTRLPYCYEFNDIYLTKLSEPLPSIYKTVERRSEHRGEKVIAEIDVDYVPPVLEQLTAWDWKELERQREINTPAYHKKMTELEEADMEARDKYRAAHPSED